MKDKELLDLAADAAGLRIKDATLDEHTGEILWLHVKNYDGDKIIWQSWNPLTDDGDALRLAVDLGFHVRIMRRCIMVEMRELHDDVMQHHGTDRRAATRRAIVRAAAEIGKAMP